MRLALTCLALLAAPAWGQAPQPQSCAPREMVFAKLAEKYGEVPVSGGVTYNQQQPTAAIIVLANKKTGTWTVLETRPDGMACMILHGQDWNGDLDPETPPEGDPA